MPTLPALAGIIDNAHRGTEMNKEGCTRIQAEGRTRDQARLFNEAQRLDLM